MLSSQDNTLSDLNVVTSFKESKKANTSLIIISFLFSQIFTITTGIDIIYCILKIRTNRNISVCDLIILPNINVDSSHFIPLQNDVLQHLVELSVGNTKRLSLSLMKTTFFRKNIPVYFYIMYIFM